MVTRQESEKWTLDDCKEDARKFSTRDEWKNNSRKAFQTAWRMGWLDICCEHMKRHELQEGS